MTGRDLGPDPARPRLITPDGIAELAPLGFRADLTEALGAGAVTEVPRASVVRGVEVTMPADYSPEQERRDHDAEAWLRERHGPDWWIGDAGPYDWQAAYDAIDALGPLCPTCGTVHPSTEGLDPADAAAVCLGPRPA
jgi:hypothetical protein